MTATDCICAIGALIGMACYLEAMLSHLNGASPIRWYVLMALLFAGAVAVRWLGG